MKIYYRPLQLSEYHLAQSFYTSVDYHILINSNDKVFAAFDGEEIVGVVRISPEFDSFTLRGMMIAQSYQRLGLGSKLLNLLKKSLPNEDCYCLPHDWLEAFYKQIGFCTITSNQAPSHLQKRLQGYIPQHPHMIVMKRPKS